MPWTALLLAIVLALPAPEPAAVPRRSAEADAALVDAFLRAAEKGTEDAVRAFIEKNFDPQALREMPVAPRLSRIHGLISRLGPFELVRPLPPAPDRVRALVRARRNSRTYRLELEIAESAAHGIAGVDLDEAEEEDSAAEETPKASDAEVAAAADAWVGQLASKEAFSGVVLLARGGRPFFLKAWGLADRGLSVPNRPDTKFNVGSIGKAFTRAAVMDLVRSGRLSLDDTVARRLPGVKIASADRITVTELLEMTSGLGDIFGEKYDATPKDRLRTLSDFLELFEGEPLRFEPGQGRAYSNAGYVVLGLIVEKLGGMPYWEFVRERVFEPAGMKDTGPFGPADVVANRATGYTRTPDGNWRANIYALPGRASSAGGVFSTAEDLLRFAEAVRAGRVHLTPVGGPAAGSGMGIAGGTVGANAILEMSPGSATVVVLANLDPPAAERVAARIRRWIPRAAGR